MANDLLSAVTTGGAFDTKTLTDTFAAVAGQNNKRKELEIKSSENAQNEILKTGQLEMRERALGLRAAEGAVREQGQEVLNQIRMSKLADAQRALTDAREYNDAVAAANVDGKPLAVRLKSDDPTEAEAAYRTFAQIRDKFRGTTSPIVNADIKAMEGLPYVQAKTDLAAKKEATRAEEAVRRGDQKDRRLDQQDNVIAETATHHVVGEKQTGQKIEISKAAQEDTARHRTVTEALSSDRVDQGNARIDETNRHNTATEGTASRNAGTAERRAATGEAAQADTSRHRKVVEPIIQQNADTRKANSENRSSSGQAKPLTLTIPNLGPMPMEKVRRVLATGIAPGATKQQAADADILRKGILAIPSGSKDPLTGAAVPRFSNADIVTWSQQGAADLAAPPAAAAVIPGLKMPTPATVAPAAPAPAAVPQVYPAPSAPGQPPAATPSTPAQDILKKYKIPARPSAEADPNPSPDILFGATQNYLAGLGILPAAQQPSGFGGFGLPGV